MKKLVLLMFGILLISSISAEIIINEQPKSIYNFGEAIALPITVKSLTDITGTLEMNLICNGQEVNFYKNGVFLKAGEEKRMEAALALTKSTITGIKGDCTIKITLGGQYLLTNDFTISDKITTNIEVEKTEIFPEESFFIKGTATKESGKQVDGFVEINFFLKSNTTSNTSAYLTKLETINKGFFQTNITAPENMKAGEYAIFIKTYEKDSTESITNIGFEEGLIKVNQIAKNLEIILENSAVSPGTNVKIKAILHDQTGENIDSTTTLTIKNLEDKIIDKVEKSTDEFYEYPLAYNQPPEEFKIIAQSGEISNQAFFNVLEKMDAKIYIINGTLFINNTGNIAYCNKSVLVKIGTNPINIDPCIPPNKYQKYELNAPDGEYEIQILTDGQETITEKAVLTGKAIELKEIQSAAGLSRYPFIWIFVIAILGFVAFTIFRKGYKRSFIGKTNLRKKSTTIIEQKPSLVPLRKKSLVTTRNRAELSLSIKGQKQNASVACLKVKNLKEIEEHKGNAEETLQKIIKLAENSKAAIYENQENIFFIFTPLKTKTFKNEMPAINFVKHTLSLLKHHNKMFKQKIDFGISLNYGAIVAKQEPEVMKFMSMGTLITTARKISTISYQEALLSEHFKEKLPSAVKTEKHMHGNTPVYTIKEIRDNKDNQKFITSFLERIEHKK